MKKCVDVSQMKTLLNQYVKQGGIKTVDKFISKSHGRSLVQHRYIAEQKTILIVDECHEALSSNRELRRPQKHLMIRLLCGKELQ